MPPPFKINPPQAAETPVVVEVPHAGVYIDPETLAFTVAPARCIGRDADLYVDRLFQDAPALGASMLVAVWSRYVVDLNRGPGDFDGEAVETGTGRSAPRGLIWRTATDGSPLLARRLPRAELERRMDALYRPYHRALRELIDQKVARFGFAILVCAHSMPDPPRRPSTLGMRAAPRSENVADIVPGTRGRTSANGTVIDLVDQLARDSGYSVRHDEPYKGGFSTAHYGNPAASVHAVQIEIARRLYLDPDTLSADPQRFESVRCFARTLVTRLGAVKPKASV
ncbi:MAG: N-formylglutamate amidohydrolase [Polyangiaceae bacterium]|nr:N-formylglutamate amidohydrolase [Polyangiaceae bacterium]